MAVRRIMVPTMVDCPHCREKNPPAESRCQSCGKPLLVYIGPADVLPRRFGLASLMLAVAVIAPCLVVLREVPAIGVVMLVVVVPALVRTLGAISTRLSDGRPMIAVEKLGVFAASLGIVWLIELAALAAFGGVFLIAAFATSIVESIFPAGRSRLGSSEWGVIVVAPVALAVALAVIYHLGRRLWAIRN